jgi:hypothetical protein
VKEAMVDLEKITEAIKNDPEILFKDLGLDVEVKNKICTHCMIHDGDNSHALYINLDKAVWYCYSKRCHETFKSSLIGFARGILSAQKLGWRSKGDKIFPFGKTIDYLKRLYCIKNCDLRITDREQKEWSQQISAISNIKAAKPFICTRDYYLNSVKIPSVYFANRGFPSEVLKEFDVGTCCRHNSYLGGRSIVPTFDMAGGKVLGLSGRAETEGLEPKWLHTNNFPSSTTLYNIWRASSYIRKDRTAILVEGPADVWRLVEAGFENAVALYGGNFSSAKHFQLDQLGVMNIFLVMDNDKAGEHHAETIIKQYGRFYNIKRTLLPEGVKDLGEMSVKQIKELGLK